MVRTDGHADLIHCTIANNTGPRPAVGVLLQRGTFELVNSIIWRNEFPSLDREISSATLKAAVRFCNIDGITEGVGNIDIAPLFVDPDHGDYGLLPDSPCLDAGDPSMPPDPDGSPPDIGAYKVGKLTAVKGRGRPGEFRLLPSRPNPFNPTTSIGFSLPHPGPVYVTVHAVTGQRVRTLVDRTLAAGAHVVAWDGTDSAGRPVGSGIYVIRLATPTQTIARRATLLR